MGSRSEVIKRLIAEVHQICCKYGIEYFLTDELALTAYRGEDISETDISSGSILMTVVNFHKFIKQCDRNLGKDRAVEWMGNNGNFPRLSARYIDTNTTYYTPQRLRYEQHLGMYITIDILRPERKTDIYCRAWEKAYENAVMKRRPTGKRLEPVLNRKFVRSIEKKGELYTAQRNANRLIKKYSGAFDSRRYWVKGENGKIRYYNSELFKKWIETDVGNLRLNISSRNEELLSEIYGKWRYKDQTTERKENNTDCFCDAEISYKDLKLGRYKSLIRDIDQAEDEMRIKLRPYKKKKGKLLNDIFRLYYRYYFGTEMADRADELEELYKEGDIIKLKDILMPYMEAMEEHGYIYINDKVSSVADKVYEVNTNKIFKAYDGNDKKKIDLYDHKGKYIRSIGG